MPDIMVLEGGADPRPPTDSDPPDLVAAFTVRMLEIDDDAAEYAVQEIRGQLFAVDDSPEDQGCIGTIEAELFNVVELVNERDL
jgi:hypothetical protein